MLGGFEPRIAGFDSGHFANWATVTTLYKCKGIHWIGPRLRGAAFDLNYP